MFRLLRDTHVSSAMRRLVLTRRTPLRCLPEMKQTFTHILQLLRTCPLFHPHLYTFEHFRWAILCVESRTFGRFLPFPSLVPFADLLNHVNVHTSYRWVSTACAGFCGLIYGCFMDCAVPFHGLRCVCPCTALCLSMH